MEGSCGVGCTAAGCLQRGQPAWCQGRAEGSVREGHVLTEGRTPLGVGVGVSSVAGQKPESEPGGRLSTGRHSVFCLSDSFTAQVLWKLLEAVKFGDTVSYQQLAALAGNPRAARAVGGAMRSNPVSWGLCGRQRGHGRAGGLGAALGGAGRRGGRVPQAARAALGREERKRSRRALP